MTERGLGGLRPSRADMRQYFFDELPGLRDHALAAADRAQDELLDAARDVLADPIEDCAGVTDGELPAGIAAGALAVSLHRLGDHNIARRPEIEREARAVMVLVDAAAGRGQRFLDGGDDADRILDGFATALPARAVLRRAFHRR